MNFEQSAKSYVDQHKDEPGWVDKMIEYYTTPGDHLAKDENGELVKIGEFDRCGWAYPKAVLAELRKLG